MKCFRGSGNPSLSASGEGALIMIREMGGMGHIRATLAAWLRGEITEHAALKMIEGIVRDIDEANGGN
jgi:hypothetical protein